MTDPRPIEPRSEPAAPMPEPPAPAPEPAAPAPEPAAPGPTPTEAGEGPPTPPQPRQTRTGRLVPALGWLLIVYVGALVALVLTALWRVDPITGELVTSPGLQNFETILTTDVFLLDIARTFAIAVLVTLTDVLIAIPVAWYLARIASPRRRGVLVAAILIPLWASYLAKVYGWRLWLGVGGPIDAVLGPLGLELSGDLRLWLVMTWLWVPYMILPLTAAFAAIPSTLLEASADLGASTRTTIRRLVLPLARPAIVLGSVFTVALTIGDYIVPTQVGGSRLVGNLVVSYVGAPGNLPLAAALALVPGLFMLGYLLVARRLGALGAIR